MFPVEVFQNTLTKLTHILHRQEIRFHLTGGLTGTAWVSKGSHKSHRDLRAINRNASGEQRAQIKAMATRLGLADLLADILSETDEIE